MKQCSLDIGFQKINYYESPGVGPAVILIHGNSLSALSFKYQFENSLGQNYRLIAFDLPGHGLSDRAACAETSYTLPGFAEVVSGVIQALKLDEVVLAGWSLGGHIFMEAIGQLDNPRGLVIFGAPPIVNPVQMSEAFLPNAAFSNFFKGDLTDEDIRVMCTNCFKPDICTIPELFKRAIRETDKNVRSILGESIMNGNFADEVTAVSGLSCPVAVFHGEYDQFVNGSYLSSLYIPTLWRGSIQVISDAGHSPQWENYKEFNKLVERFQISIAMHSRLCYLSLKLNSEGGRYAI